MVVADAAPAAPAESGALATLTRLEVALALPPGAGTRMHARLRQLVPDELTRVVLVLDHERPEIHVVVAGIDPMDTAARATTWLATSALIAPVIERLLAQGATPQLHVRLWPPTGRSVALRFAADARGPVHAPALVEASLAELGMVRAWHHVMAMLPRGPELDEIAELELRSDDGALGVEVGVRHREAGDDVLAASLSAMPGIDPDRLVRFFHRMTHGVAPRGGLAPITALRFVAADPVAMTLRVPMRAYVRHDEEACARIDAFGRGGQHANLGGARLLRPGDCGLLRAGADAVLGRPIDVRSTVTSSVALACGPGGESVSVELGGEVPRATDRPPDLDLEQMVRRYEDALATQHPFVAREEREATDLRHVWLLLDNIHASFSQHSPRRLAGVIARIDDDEIRSLLARQLDRELGCGDFTRARRRLFREMLDACERWRPARMDASLLRPGTRLSARLDAIHADEHPFVGVGAAIVRQMCVRQLGAFVAARFLAHGDATAHARLQDVLPLAATSEPMELVRAIVHDDQRRAVWRGAAAVHAACWAALDDMYRLCFPP